MLTTCSGSSLNASNKRRREEENRSEQNPSMKILPPHYSLAPFLAINKVVLKLNDHHTSAKNISTCHLTLVGIVTEAIAIAGIVRHHQLSITRHRIAASHSPIRSEHLSYHRQSSVSYQALFTNESAHIKSSSCMQHQYPTY